MSLSQNWIDLIGKHIKYIYQKLESLEKEIAAANERIGELEKEASASRSKLDSEIKRVREETLTRAEFSDFVEDVTRALLTVPFQKSAEAPERSAETDT